MSHDDTTTEAEIDPTLSQLLRHMIKIESFELIVSSGNPATFRVDQNVYAARAELHAEQIQQMLETIMTPVQADDFSDRLEADLRLTHAAHPFRINVFMQRGAPGMVVRRVRTQLPSASDCGLTDDQAARLLRVPGIILCVSSSSRARADLLATLVDARNSSGPGHIVTLESPIEYLHASKRCVVTQRELGLDTHSSCDALQRALRQAPDMVAIADLRDAESVESTLTLAERGQLVVAALPAESAAAALKAVLDLFAPSRQHDLRMRLARALRAVLCRNPLPGSHDALGSLALTLATPQVVGVIERGALHRLAMLTEGEGDALGAHAYGGLTLRLAPAPDEPSTPAPAPERLSQPHDRRRASGMQQRPSLVQPSTSAVRAHAR